MAAGESGLYGGNSKPGNETPAAEPDVDRAAEPDVDLAQVTAPECNGSDMLTFQLRAIATQAMRRISDRMRSLVS